MNNTIKLLYSLLIGVVAMGIAKLVHPSWSINQLLIFGFNGRADDYCGRNRSFTIKTNRKN